MATVPNDHSAIPDWLTGLVDDAAIFPPGNVPLDRAIAEHRLHRTSEYAALLGGFVISDVRLPELLDVLDDVPDDDAVETPLAVNVVVTGGAGAIEPAVRWATRTPLLRLEAVECLLRDEGDLSRNAQRVCAALDAVVDDLGDAAVYVEPPNPGREPGVGWLAALDQVAARDLRLKFRTGGTTTEAFPTEDELLACIDAALDRELPFKCTAGLHHAVRHRDEHTGFEHHGFLNVLLATRLLLDDEPDPAWTALNQHDPGITVAQLLDHSVEELQSARRWFTSFGSCSILEPHDDLVELDLVRAGAAS